MRWVWCLVILIFILFFYNFLRKADYTNQKKVDSGIIKQPHWYATGMIYVVIGFNILGICILTYQKEFFLGALFAIVSIFPLLLYLFFKNWKVEYYEDKFYFTNMWKRKKEYSYNEVRFVDTGRALKVYKKRKMIVGLSYLMVNAFDFESSYNEWKKKNRV